VDIANVLAEVRTLPPRAAIARERRLLRRDALDGSLAIAASPLAPAELTALVERGVTIGVHPLDAYLVARDLTAGADWVAGQPALRPDDRRALLTIEDIRRIHEFVAAGSATARPGMWRLAVAIAEDGVVSPPPWIVPFELGALVERVRRRPDPARLAEWLSSFLIRFARLRPFAAANGRTGRLAAGLLLQRLDEPPLVIPRAQGTAYVRALRAGLAGEPEALEQLVAAALVSAANRLVAAAGDEPLRPLRALAPDRYAALVKAAKRGRLRCVVRDGRVLSLPAWIAAYSTKRA
jgi:Fic family protein